MTVTAPQTAGTSTRPPAQPTRRRRRVMGLRPPVWFVLPAVLLYLAVVFLPNIQGLLYSFTNWDGFGTTWKWVGVENFSSVFADPNSMRAIGNTFLLTLVVSLGQNIVGLLLALGLNARIKSKYVLRLVFFLPVVLTPIVAGYLWKYILTPGGTLNTALEGMGLGFLRQDWLGNPDLVIYAICATIIWQGSGYSMVIYLAGLQAVPAEALEAAAIDGAGAVRRTISIVIPLINGSIVVNMLLSVIGNLKQFDTVYSMTGGGPGSASETMATIVYKTAFTYLRYPNALAQAVILTLLVGVIAFIQFRLTQRKGALA